MCDETSTPASAHDVASTKACSSIIICARKLGRMNRKLDDELGSLSEITPHDEPVALGLQKVTKTSSFFSMSTDLQPTFGCSSICGCLSVLHLELK